VANLIPADNSIGWSIGGIADLVQCLKKKPEIYTISGLVNLSFPEIGI
jgi:hypothetical protein